MDKPDIGYVNVIVELSEKLDNRVYSTGKVLVVGVIIEKKPNQLEIVLENTGILVLIYMVFGLV